MIKILQNKQYFEQKSKLFDIFGANIFKIRPERMRLDLGLIFKNVCDVISL
jgi:hypothetical protein